MKTHTLLLSAAIISLADWRMGPTAGDSDPASDKVRQFFCARASYSPNSIEELAEAEGLASGRLPGGLSASDWVCIRKAHELNRHAAVAVEGGFVARNPGQQWRTRFDGRGFETAPDADGWSWGLELVKYGRKGIERTVTTPSCINANGQRVEYQWDENLTEWYINDRRGLEHGYTVQQRPQGAGSLQLTLSVRGGLNPQVSADRRAITFVNKSGAAVVNYAGLKVFDATGAAVPAWFEFLPAACSLQPAAFSIVIDDSTALYPLTIDPIAQQAYLKASNTGAGDRFGYTVAVSGETAVIGAFQEASNATGVNGNQADNSAPNSGAAYVFVRAGGVWSQQAYLKASNSGANDEFGRCVAISGDTIVVGARAEDSSATGANGNQGDNSANLAGAAYVFVRSGTTWSQQAYLKASNTGVGDQFGMSVDISGETIAVGAGGEDSNATGVNGNQADNSVGQSGAAYVFVRSGGIWSQQAYLKASNTGATDDFGQSVAISGDTVVVGAASENSSATGVDGNQADESANEAGAAYVFVRDIGGVWSQQAYLKASNTDTGDIFGSSVAISGDTVVIGADQEDSSATGAGGNQADNSATDAGAAYVFIRSGGIWSQQAYLKAANTETNDLFGISVAISGDTVVVGAVEEDSNATGINGNHADNSATDSGAAYVFVRNNGIWGHLAYLKASNTEASDILGLSVAISGDTVLAGAFAEDGSATGVNGNQADNSASSSGAAYVFVLDADGDGVTDSIDVCPNNAIGLPVCANGRPQRDCNNDCLYDAADIQCLVDELLNQ